MNIDRPANAPSRERDKAAGHKLGCAECCSQLPPAQATNFEMEDYVLHFCSATCLRKWQARSGNAATGQDQAG